MARLASLWSVPAQVIGYPHREAAQGSYPFARDTTEAHLATVFLVGQVLDE